MKVARFLRPSHRAIWVKKTISDFNMETISQECESHLLTKVPSEIQCQTPERQRERKPLGRKRYLQKEQVNELGEIKMMKGNGAPLQPPSCSSDAFFTLSLFLEDFSSLLDFNLFPFAFLFHSPWHRRLENPE